MDTGPDNGNVKVIIVGIGSRTHRALCEVGPMTKKKAKMTAASVTPPRADDFTRINDIKPHIADSLHNADILTFAQLAALSPEDIAEVLGNNPLHSAEHIEKQDWIGQARELASRTAPVSSGDLTIPNGRQRLATFTVELLLDRDGHVRRTHIVHFQDGQKFHWNYWEGKGLLDFIVEHAAVQQGRREPCHTSGTETTTERPLVVPPTEALLVEVPAPQSSNVEVPQAALQLEVTDVSVAQVPAQQWEAVQDLSRRLRAQVNFRLSGTVAEEVTANESPYAVQTFACELVSGQTLVLGEAHGQLRPGVLEYISEIEFPFPSTGRYQIMGVVLLPHNNHAGAGLGPVLRSVSER
jgi:predicted flap endonuclease-1-like 5' DNA nuclease